MTTTERDVAPSAPSSSWVSGRRRWWIAAAVVIALAAGLLIARASASSDPKPPPASVGSQLDDALPASIANLPLTDEYGHRTELAAFAGKTVVINPFMTSCQEVCPITTAELNQADRAVTRAGLASKVAFVDITIDPERDTPSRLHAYRSFAQLPDNWSLLTGTPDDLHKLWSYFGVSYERTAEANPPGVDWLTNKPLTYDVSHNDVTTFVDASGHRRFILQGMPVGANSDLTAGERAFLDDTGRANLADPKDASWTSPQAVQVLSWLAKKHLRPVS